MPQPNDIVTLAELKEYLGLPAAAASTDAAYSQLISSISQWAETYCNRKFALTNYNETYDGTGTQTMVLRAGPVVAVASVHVFAQELQPSDSPARMGYAADGRVLYLMAGGVFPYCKRAVRVQYSAGYQLPEFAPFDLKQAVLESVVSKFNRRSNPEVASRMIANETISYTTAQVPAGALTVFNAYRLQSPL